MKNLSKTAILFYVLGLLSAIYTVFLGVTSIDTIKLAIEGGQISIPENIGEIIVFFVNAVGNFLFYTVVLFGMGYGIQALKKIHNDLSIFEEITFDEDYEESNEEPTIIEEDEEVVVVDTTQE